MSIKSLVEKYKDDYHIPYQDLKDAGESNRLNSLAASSLLLLSQSYLLLYVGLSASIFNFYFLDSPHNGFLTYYMAGFLFVFIFSVSPLYFFLELIGVLWGDRADSAHYGGSLRNLIVDIKHTFKELGRRYCRSSRAKGV